jgi:hypothetical protein
VCHAAQAIADAALGKRRRHFFWSSELMVCVFSKTAGQFARCRVLSVSITSGLHDITVTLSSAARPVLQRWIPAVASAGALLLDQAL